MSSPKAINTKLHSPLNTALGRDSRMKTLKLASSPHHVSCSLYYLSVAVQHGKLGNKAYVSDCQARVEERRYRKHLDSLSFRPFGKKNNTVLYSVRYARCFLLCSSNSFIAHSSRRGSNQPCQFHQGKDGKKIPRKKGLVSKSSDVSYLLLMHPDAYLLNWSRRAC